MSRMIVPVLCAVFAAACSNQSPVVPSEAGVAGTLDAKPSAGSGSGRYDLAFFNYAPGTASTPGRYEEVSSLQANSGSLMLRGSVTDSSGNQTLKGTIRFEYCSKGRPYNDINNPDEMPMEACAQGTAKWTLLDSRTIGTIASCPPAIGGGGFVCHQFGRVQIPRQIGFRINYQPQGSGIAAGASAPENFTWY